MFENIAYWQRHGEITPEELNDKAVAKVIQQLREEQYKSAQVEKLEGEELYTARIDSKKRLVFALIQLNNEPTLLILAVHSKHKHHELFRELSTVVASLKHDTLPAERVVFLEDKPIEPSLIEQSPPIEPTPLKFYNQQFIVFNSEQDKAVSAPIDSTVIIRGPAGSGKTCVALELLYQAQQHCAEHAHFEVLFIASSPYLISALNESYKKSPYANRPGFNQAAILSFSHLLQRLDPSLTPEHQADFDVFKRWIAKYFKDHQGCNIFSPNVSHLKKSLNIDFFFHTFRQLSGRDEFDEQIGKQELAVSPEQLLWLRKAYQGFRHFLATQQLFYPDFVDASLETLNPQKEYLLIIEEAQDFTPAQHYLFHQLSKRKITIVYDSKQLIQGGFSIGYFLDRLYTGGAQTLVEIDLPYTYRCPRNIIALANEIDRIKGCLTGGLGEKKEALKITGSEKTLAGAPGLVELFTEESLAIEQINARHANQPNTVILTSEQHKATVKQLFNNHPSVFTPAEFKGLEGQVIILYRPFDEVIYRDICHAIQEFEGIEDYTHTHRPKQGQGANRLFRKPLQELFVSITRTLNRLIILQPDSQSQFNLEPLLRLLKRIIDCQEAEAESFLEVNGDVNALWLERFQQFLANGHDEQARAIWIQHLKGSEQSFRDQQQARDERLHQQASDALLSRPPSAIAKAAPVKSKLKSKRNKNKNKSKKNKKSTVSAGAATYSEATNVLLNAVNLIIDKAHAYNYLKASEEKIGNYRLRLSQQITAAQSVIEEGCKLVSPHQQSLINLLLNQITITNGYASEIELAHHVLIEASHQGLFGINNSCKKVIITNRGVVTASYLGFVIEKNLLFDVIRRKIFLLKQFPKNSVVDHSIPPASEELTYLRIVTAKTFVEHFKPEKILSTQGSNTTYLTIDYADTNPNAIQTNQLFAHLYHVFLNTLTQPIYLENKTIAEQVRGNIQRDYISVLSELITRTPYEGISAYTPEVLHDYLLQLIPNPAFVTFIMALSYKYSNPGQFREELQALLADLKTDSTDCCDQWLITNIDPLIIESIFEKIEDQYAIRSHLDTLAINSGGYHNFLEIIANATLSKILPDEKSKQYLRPYYAQAALSNSNGSLSQIYKIFGMFLQSSSELLPVRPVSLKFKTSQGFSGRLAIRVENLIYDLYERKAYWVLDYYQKFGVVDEPWIMGELLPTTVTAESIAILYQHCEEKYLQLQKDVLIDEIKHNRVRVRFAPVEKKGDLDASVVFCYLEKQLEMALDKENHPKYQKFIAHTCERIMNEFICLYYILVRKVSEEIIQSYLNRALNSKQLASIIINSAVILGTNRLATSKVWTSQRISNAYTTLQSIYRKNRDRVNSSSRMQVWLQEFIATALAKNPSTMIDSVTLINQDYAVQDQLSQQLKFEISKLRACSYLSEEGPLPTGLYTDRMNQIRQKALDLARDSLLPQASDILLSYVLSLPNLKSTTRSIFQGRLCRDLTSSNLINDYLECNVSISRTSTSRQIAINLLLNGNIRQLINEGGEVICLDFKLDANNTIVTMIEFNESLYSLSDGKIYPLGYKTIYPFIQYNFESFNPSSEELRSFSDDLLSNIFESCLMREQTEGLSQLFFEPEGNSLHEINVTQTFSYLYKKFMETFKQSLFVNNPDLACQVRYSILQDFTRLVQELREATKKSLVYNQDAINSHLNNIIQHDTLRRFIIGSSYEYTDFLKFKQDLLNISLSLRALKKDQLEQWLLQIIPNYIKSTFIKQEEVKFSWFNYPDSNKVAVKKYLKFLERLGIDTLNSLLESLDEDKRCLTYPYYARNAHFINGLKNTLLLAMWLLSVGIEVKILSYDVTVEQLTFNEDDIRIGLLDQDMFYDLAHKTHYRLSDLISDHRPIQQITLGRCCESLSKEEITRLLTKGCKRLSLTQHDLFIAMIKENNVFTLEEEEGINANEVFRYLYGLFTETVTSIQYKTNPEVAYGIRSRIMENLKQLYFALYYKYYSYDIIINNFSRFVSDKEFIELSAITAMISISMHNSGQSALTMRTNALSRLESLIKKPSFIARIDDPIVHSMYQFIREMPLEEQPIITRQTNRRMRLSNKTSTLFGQTELAADASDNSAPRISHSM